MVKKPKKTKKEKTDAGSTVKTEQELADLRSSGNRIPIQLLVDYKSDGHYLFDFCRDLGTGGLFIETANPLNQGSSLDLTFTIPDSKETLTTKGKVIWVQKAVEDRKELIPGMGVQFEAFDNDQRGLLENFVRRYHGVGFAGLDDAVS